MCKNKNKDEDQALSLTCTFVLEDGLKRCGLPVVKKRKVRVVLCAEHHAQYVERTKTYKQDSREADRLPERTRRHRAVSSPTSTSRLRGRRSG